MPASLPECGYSVERMTPAERNLSELESRIGLLHDLAAMGTEGQVYFALWAVGHSLRRLAAMKLSPTEQCHFTALEDSLGAPTLVSAYQLSRED